MPTILQSQNKVGWVEETKPNTNDELGIRKFQVGRRTAYHLTQKISF